MLSQKTVNARHSFGEAGPLIRICHKEPLAEPYIYFFLISIVAQS